MLTATGTTATGLTNGTSYTFRLAVTGGFNAGNSNTATATPQAPVPIADLAASVGNTQVVLAWTAPIGATAVELQVKETGADDSTYAKATYATTDAQMVTATGTTATGLTNGTGYTFRLVVTGGSNAGNSNTVSATPAASMTIMFYGDGDNNLEPYLMQDIAEMKLGVTNDVNLIALVDRVATADDWDSDDVSVLGENFTDTRLYKITKNSATRIGGSTQLPGITTSSNYEANMGDAITLKNYIDFCKANYPADKYMLIMWNHGGGTRAFSSNNTEVTKNICEDITSGNDILYTGEITDVLGVAQSVDIIGFDACLMGSIEVAYQFRPSNGDFHADTMIASPPLESAGGWKYDKFLKRLDSSLAGSDNGESDITLGGNELYFNPYTITNTQLGAIVVEERRDANPLESLSCYDLSKVETVKQALDTLVSSNALSMSKADFLSKMENARCTTTAYFNVNEENSWLATPFFDLYDLATKMGTEGIDTTAVKTAVDDFIVYSYSGNNYCSIELGFTCQEGKNGVSIFFPDGDRTYTLQAPGNLPHWAYQWWYNSIDTTALGANFLYGKLQWCSDGATPSNTTVSNWFEMLDYFFDVQDVTGGMNGYEI